MPYVTSGAGLKLIVIRKDTTLVLSSKLEEAERGMGDLCLGISTGGVGSWVKRDVQERYV